MTYFIYQQPRNCGALRRIREGIQVVETRIIPNF
jgi:hypothetical protein